jgi:hypothetical protein
VLLEVVLTARTRLTAGVGALEGLDTRVYPLVTLEVAASGEAALADGADVRLGLALSGAGRTVLALGSRRDRGRLGSRLVRVLVAVGLCRVAKSRQRRGGLRRALLVSRRQMSCSVG